MLGLASCSRTNTLVVLLPEEQNTSGTVNIGEGGRTVTLDTPLHAARVNTRGQIQETTLTRTEIEQHFADTLSAQPPPSSKFILYFQGGSTEFMPESQPTLEALFAEMARHQAAEVQVTGHTDRVGSDADNDRLSLERAQTVRDMLLPLLQQRGLPANFIRAVGRGEREPIIPTPDNQPEPRNRRVEVIVR
jgi:outer membrane protein OmpA-like peptidoglycan-associated protein